MRGLWPPTEKEKACRHPRGHDAVSATGAADLHRPMFGLARHGQQVRFAMKNLLDDDIV